MIFFDAIILSIVQGITESIPVSSTAHLLLFTKLLKVKNNVAFDAALHLGSLAAIVIYFRKDITKMYKSMVNIQNFNLKSYFNQQGIRLIICILIASAPLAITGFTVLIYDLRTHNIHIIAYSLIVFGIIMGLIDYLFSKKLNLEKISYKQAIIIGLFNAMAALPGVSRSGSCITGARMLGFNRFDSARFSFLLSLPSIFGGAIATYVKMSKQGVEVFNYQTNVAIFICGVISFITIHLFMKMLQKYSLLPIMIYRIVVGAILLLIF